MNGMRYKGFSASIGFDAEDEIFVGRIVGINDVIGFHADNVEELKAAFHEQVDSYIEACAELGKQPEKSYSGSLMVRVDPTVHAAAAKAAELTGSSLAEWAESRLREAAQRDLGAAV